MSANHGTELRSIFDQKRHRKSVLNQVSEISLLLGIVLLGILFIANLVVLGASFVRPDWFLRVRRGIIGQEHLVPVFIVGLAYIPLIIKQIRQESVLGPQRWPPIRLSSKIILI